MGSPENLSKRERQKARRNAKLQQQAVLDKKARRNRLLTFALLGVIFLGLIGFAVYDNWREGEIARKRAEEVAAKLDELGCTEIQEPEDRGTGHLDSQTLAASPPEILYPDRPATSGEHFGNWLMTGVYDEIMDERALVHNQEHGYVLGYYSEDAPEDQIAAFKAKAQEHIDGDFPKIIVSPWDGDLPEDANFAYVAWNNRQLCGEFDEDVFLTFVEDHHSSAGDAPPAEKSIPAHLEPGGGTIDPEGEAFLLPPLGTAATPTEGISEVPSSEGAATEVAPTEGSS